MYRRKPRGRVARPGPLSQMPFSDNSDGGAPLYSPSSPDMKKIGTTVETDGLAVPVVETQPVGHSGGAPINGGNNANIVELSANTVPQQATSQGSKLNPNTKPFVPPSAEFHNTDVKVLLPPPHKRFCSEYLSYQQATGVPVEEEVKIQMHNCTKPREDAAKVLMKMINATTRPTSSTNGQTSIRIPHSRTFNDGFGSGPAFVPDKRDTDQDHAAGVSTFAGPSMHVQQTGYPETVQCFDRSKYGNGTMYTGQQAAGNLAQSDHIDYTAAAQGIGYQSSYMPSQHPGNMVPMVPINGPMPAHSYGQQIQHPQHSGQHIAPGDVNYAARDYQDNRPGHDSGGHVMNPTAFQQGLSGVRNLPGDNTTGQRSDADLGNRIADARQAMDRYNTAPAASYGNNTTTQTTPTLDRATARAHPVNAPTPARAQLPMSNSGLEGLLGINKPVPMFQPPTAEVKAQRSEMLNRLVGDSGLPKIHSLMDPDNFPFIEPGRAHTAVDYGVVKLKNVRLFLLLLISLLLN
jgi:hypothetical protein